MDTSKVVTIPEPRLERAGPDLWRIVATVEGTDVFFESHVPLSPRPEVRDSLGTTVRACGLEFVVVRTNIRAHPLFRAVKWGIVHVSALAAGAHALGPRVHKMYVAASDVPPPSGSAPDLDASWSSEAVSLENYSAELTRLQRVESIARWELLRGGLRVCLIHNTTELNCGSCEKCLRTKMQLYVSGAPDGLDSFPRELPLRSTLGSLYAVSDTMHDQWREIAARVRDRRMRKPIERLLQRRRQPLWRRGLRHFRRIATRGLRHAFAG
jgi:hypothetical protein